MRAGVAAKLRARMRGSGHARGALGACAGVGLALILAACGPASAGSNSSQQVGTTPTDGGTATYAMLPSFNPNYIFPFVSSTYDTTANVNDFQYLMYRPLYWFGSGTGALMNSKLSLAYPPKYSGQVVTIKLKPYQWSNGHAVTAQDVVFWLHMMKAEAPLNNWGGYTPGDLPDDVTNIRAVNASEVQMTVKGTFADDWFTSNELSQITPMPQAWDVTQSGPSHCTTQVSDCVAVYNYLNAQSAKMSAWASSKLWSVVDGPWSLQKVTSQGYVYLGYNPHYTGPKAAHHINQFVLEPFTSEQAEFNVLQDPQAGQKIDVGYLPTVDAPVPPPGAQTGPNPVTLSNYRLSVVYPWALSYFPYNFNNTQGQGAIFKQQYFRIAFQSLIDQEGVINGPMHGYGKATIGPLATYPVTPYVSSFLKQKGDQWPLNPSRAKNLLASNGWHVNTTSGGVDTCVNPGTGPGHCGAGIRRGAPMTFNLIYSSGLDWMESQTKELVSNASLVGIHINTSATPIESLLGTVFGCQNNNTCGTAWQLADWGAWTYDPDYLPTGEELFTGVANDGNAGNNAGDYYTAENNNLIAKTLLAKGNKAFDNAMYKWENYLAVQLPVVYQPNVATLVEAVDNLHIGPQNSALTLTPEDWYYLK